MYEHIIYYQYNDLVKCMLNFKQSRSPVNFNGPEVLCHFGATVEKCAEFVTY